MRFRQQQDDARQATRNLLGLFALMLCGLVLAVNALLIGLWWLLFSWLTALPPLFVETNTALVLLFVLGGCLVETVRLRNGGGRHVAAWAGGRELSDTRNGAERRLLNIVAEMALSSGLPRPAVFVLDREDAINAFAAGWSADAAVIAVTRGALERLTRDELQGLVAHEFGHIHQGDLRLNMVLLALVWGLSLVHGYGRRLMAAGDDGHRSPLGVIIGAVFMAAGSLGWLAGQMLQAAVSRQRELLADACAVQFTRSREGLGGTLRKVWHQALHHDDRLRQVPARLLAGMLLQAPPSWLASHPPLPERLRRLYGRAVEPLAAPLLQAGPESEPGRSTLPPVAMDSATMGLATSPPGGAPHPPSPRPLLDEDQRDAMDRLSRINGPGELRATVLALLLTPDSLPERRAWREETRGLSTAEALRNEVGKLSPAARLPWLEVLLGRLAPMPLADRQLVAEAARRVMAADGQIRPIDRLHWLALRHRLGQTPPVMPASDGDNDLHHLSWAALNHVARFTAFLSRLVPTGDPEAGQAWYAAVIGHWLGGQTLPLRDSPDADGVVHALLEVQSLPWMLRPVLVRAWVEAALDLSPLGRLEPMAADALRLASLLLDSPLPPELARHYIEPRAA